MTPAERESLVRDAKSFQQMADTIVNSSKLSLESLDGQRKALPLVDKVDELQSECRRIARQLLNKAYE